MTETGTGGSAWECLQCVDHGRAATPQDASRALWAHLRDRHDAAPPEWVATGRRPAGLVPPDPTRRLDPLPADPERPDPTDAGLPQPGAAPPASPGPEDRSIFDDDPTPVRFPPAGPPDALGPRDPWTAATRTSPFLD